MVYKIIDSPFFIVSLHLFVKNIFLIFSFFHIHFYMKRPLVQIYIRLDSMYLDKYLLWWSTF